LGPDMSGNNGRTTDGRYASGNPGRPFGARHKTTIAIEALLEGQAEKITQKAIDKAMEGDPVAIRLCLERILPPRKDRPISFELPKIEDCTGAMKSLLASVAAGNILPEEGTAVAILIEKHVRIREGSDFEARLRALEERIGDGDGK
jgi:hypothetical protein